MLINPIVHYENRIRRCANDYKLVPLILEDVKIGRYLVSNYGEIYDIYQNKWLNGWMQKDGYRRYSLATEDGRRKIYSQTLVNGTFNYNPNPELYTVVNHIDGNKLHCHESNLESCTPKYNSEHAVNNGLYSGPIFEQWLIEEICVALQLGKSVREVCTFFSMYTNYSYPQLKALVDGMIKGTRYSSIYNQYNIT